MRVLFLNLNQKQYILIFVILTFLVTILYRSVRCYSNETRVRVLIEERNTLSHRLNEIMKLYGQQSCEMLKMKQEDSRVSEHGGWCWSMSSPDSKEHKWDKGFSEALSIFLKGKTVVSFGEGPGAYKKHLDSQGHVKNYTAYDGAPYIEDVTEGLVRFLDLTCPQYGLPIFDWAISVEVGEHISEKYEDIFIDNLVRHASEGLILSWADKGQGGLSHVNTKSLEDVIIQMNKRGFAIDIQAGEPLRKASTLYWLRNNVQVYYRITKNSLNELNG